MALVEREESLVDMLHQAIELLLEGHGNDINWQKLQEKTPELATILGELKQILDATHHHMSSCFIDLPIVNQHLAHIAKSTENGVLTVLNTAEAIMNDAGKIKDILNTIPNDSPQNEILKPTLAETHNLLSSIQDNSFSILTSLEFEDANRQLMEKIILRLEDQLIATEEILTLLKKSVSLNKNDSTFLKGLKHIIDLESSTRQSQDMIDDYFEDFGS